MQANRSGARPWSAVLVFNLAVALSLASAFWPVVAAPDWDEAPELAFGAVWARPGLAGGSSAVYFTVANHGERSWTLTGAESPVAEAVEIHETVIENRVMHKGRVAEVEIPPRGSSELKPGRIHVVLLGLKDDLKTGDAFRVTLHFRDEASVEIGVSVRWQARKATFS